MAKIHINVQSGVIEIEGDEAFVREAYKDVRASMANFALVQVPTPATVQEAPKDNSVTEGGGVVKSAAKPKHKAKPKATQPKGGGLGLDKYYKGTFNPNMDFSKLKDHLKKFDPKNNMNRNLVFSSYLRDVLKIEPCSADEIYSCYYSQKSDISIPEAFGKSLMDTRREGFLSFTDFSSLTIPTVGENRLSELEKAATVGD